MSGKTRISVNGIDIGECNFSGVEAQYSEIAESSMEKPKTIELIANVVLDPDSWSVITDFILQSELGEHYKN